MLGVLGLLTGWALLTPLIILIYLRLGGPYFRWMEAIGGIATSVPMLGFCTIGGIVMMIWSVGELTRREDDIEPQR
jgi:hypothetical protein